MNLDRNEMTDRDEDQLHVVHPTHSNKVLSDNGHSSLMMVLKKQRLEIDDVIDTIQDNINQERTDLHYAYMS